MRNLLFLSYYFPPMGMGGVQRSIKLVKYLPEFEWNPIVLTVKDILYHGHDPSLERDAGRARVIRTESLDPLRLSFRARGPAKASPGVGVPSLSVFNRSVVPWIFIPDSKTGWIPFAVSEGIRLAGAERIHAVFTTSPPHSAHLAGWMLKRRLGIPWVADFRDSWMRESFDRVPTPVHRTLNETMLRFVLKSADRVTGISGPILEDMRFLSGRPAGDFVRIPNGFDPDDFRGFRHEGSKRFGVTYCGTVNAVHSPAEFLAGAGEAVRREPRLRSALEIRFIGAVSDVDLDGMVRRHGLDGLVTRTGYVSHAESIRHLARSDVLLLVLPPESSPGVVTGKLFEYLATGLPIIAVVPKGEAAEIINQSGRGPVVHPSDSAGIASALIGLYHEWKRSRGKRTGVIRTDLWTEQFSRRRQAEQLARILEKLIA
jgi:glycosyltransferase involved in cell wall biosynthesis